MEVNSQIQAPPPLNLGLKLSPLNKAFLKAIQHRKSIETEYPGEFSPKPAPVYSSPPGYYDFLAEGEVSPVCLGSGACVAQGGSLAQVDKLPGIRFGAVEIIFFTPGSQEGHSPICNHNKDASVVDEGSQTFRPSAEGGSSSRSSNLSK
jgi:hypothetical protein